MTTVDYRCAPELKQICVIIGWIGIVANVIFGLVFSYRLNQNIGSFLSTLSLLIVIAFHFVGSICLLVATNVENKLFFLPWVLSNLAAIILLLVGAFIWDTYYYWIMMPIMLWAQAYVCKYIAERMLEDKRNQQLNV